MGHLVMNVRLLLRELIIAMAIKILQGNMASYCPPIDQSDCNMISSHTIMCGIILFLRKVLPRKFQVALKRYCIILTICMVCGAKFGGSGIQYRFETENTQLLP